MSDAIKFAIKFCHRVQNSPQPRIGNADLNLEIEEILVLVTEVKHLIRFSKCKY